MKKRSILIMTLLLCVMLPLGGCTAASAQDLMSGVKAAERPSNPAEPDGTFRASMSGFSWNLFREAGRNTGNILISPASVYIALAMTLNGADAETRAAMIAAMSAAGLTEDELNKTCRDYMALLQNAGNETSLSIANSIWYRDGFNPDPGFLQKNADYFAAAARALDFNLPAAVDTINGWVKDNTGGKIEKIVESIGADVVMYLINAVYFKADWMVPFSAAGTYDGDFTTPAGVSTVKTMHRTGSMNVLSGPGAKGVLLPYKDGRFAFLALLPDEGSDPRTLITNMTADSLTAMIGGKQEKCVDLSLPKFETKFENSLKDELSDMGMGVAFDPGLADFSKMNADHLKNLFISEIKHKTFCRVDEKGTEAAAVTSVEVSLTSMPVSDLVLEFNRPFVYGIIDTITGLPLFLGVMDNPAES